MNSNTNVIQVTNVSPSTTSEQMRTLFGFLGKIEELKLFPPDDSPLPVTSRVCFVKFLESESVGVSQHLTNTVFVDRALIVVPYAEGVIPDEAKALSLLAPANAVAGLLPGGGLLPTPNPLASIGGVPLAALGGPTLDPALAALGLPGSNMNSQSLTADQLLKLMTTVDPKLNHMAAGMNLNPGLKADSSSKEIEEAMKRVREAQSLISAAIEPGNKKDEKRKHSRSRSRSRRRRSRSRSRHRRSKSRSRRRSHSRGRRRSKSPRRRKSHSKERGRRSRSKSRYEIFAVHPLCKPALALISVKAAGFFVNISAYFYYEKCGRQDLFSQNWFAVVSVTITPVFSLLQVTRDYDEEEQGYDSEKERGEKQDLDPAMSPDLKGSPEKGTGEVVKEPKVNGDDHHEEDMDMSE
uniref:Serine and arginine rich splicing factor 11 n=1 Tax=Scleropages formosus TaxID=113540 RepID=A0A8C9VN42_SCLFO